MYYAEKSVIITLSNNFETYKVVVKWDGTDNGKIESRKRAFEKARELGFNGAFVASEQY